MKEVALCSDMGWTYQDYLSQPKWFIYLLFKKMEIDSNKLKNKRWQLRKN